MASDLLHEHELHGCMCAALVGVYRGSAVVGSMASVGQREGSDIIRLKLEWTVHDWCGCAILRITRHIHGLAIP